MSKADVIEVEGTVVENLRKVQGYQKKGKHQNYL